MMAFSHNLKFSFKCEMKTMQDPMNAGSFPNLCIFAAVLMVRLTVPNIFSLMFK